MNFLFSQNTTNITWTTLTHWGVASSISFQTNTHQALKTPWSRNIELFHIIDLKTKIMNIILIYRTPNCKSEDSILKLKNLLTNMDYMSNPCIIMGDFYIDLLKKDENDTKTTDFDFLI